MQAYERSVAAEQKAKVVVTKAVETEAAPAEKSEAKSEQHA